MASDELDPLELREQKVAERLKQRNVGDLQYYNAQVHGALFALPGYYRDLLKPQ